MREAPCFFSGGGRERKGMDRILILLMEQVTVRTQLTITRKVRIQIARTEKSRKNQTVTDSPQRLRRFQFLTFRRAISLLSLSMRMEMLLQLL